eukprot:CAMPEP_0204418550 /NCGR_PEP_ID=MMETSP0470-20130426/29811_1 /ASSEMBLY_ACC=CAM_ASM_000385 /TAXON_ID=2969 /ORGANISM="Oxyrrhis marina" /LENGTH=32 /DNA_ID= /DNA_START= /DNA_END= /DNA_ORIENTATION=
MAAPLSAAPTSISDVAASTYSPHPGALKLALE